MTALVLAGLFGHRRPDDPLYLQWFHTATAWIAAHWGVLAVAIPAAGGIAAGIVNHYLALARDERARKVASSAKRERVHADLAARLLSHCTLLQRNAVREGGNDLRAWREANAALRRRAEMHDVIEVLASDYVGFMAAIEHERRTMEAAAAHRRGGAVASVVDAYAPFIAAFGEGEQARRLVRLVRSGRI